MTVYDYITRTRQKLGDTVQPYRFQDAEIRASLSEALIRGRQYRPSLAYADGALVAAADDVNFLTGSVALAVRVELDRASEALVLLAAARCLANDTADTLNVAAAEKMEAKGMAILMS